MKVKCSVYTANSKFQTVKSPKMKPVNLKPANLLRLGGSFNDL
ncbi:hypothetical protein HanXRQr2_Chr17g0826821 [Helianthus annuus]|uniref:Uncharacterized protein n=1 Tax=Helianthus annuus TaxID=4232 RepID=A0A9K3GX41_HELAN|nr:hypothetical protein HanXRQr2_Chr17g0826821 [Helianthus annuus]